MSRLLKYRAETEKFFKDYLPDEMFIKLGSAERILFRKFRESHKIIESKEKEILISAQAYLINFYNNLGFVQEGEQYLEDDIPHIKMLKS